MPPSRVCFCYLLFYLLSDWLDYFSEVYLGFPGNSAGKEFACNAGGPGSIPGSGRSPGEGTVYPFQYFSASLAVQMIKNLPAMQETWVRSLGWEDPLEEGMATHSNILAWRIPIDRGAWPAIVHVVAKGQTGLSDWLCMNSILPLQCLTSYVTPQGHTAFGLSKVTLDGNAFGKDLFTLATSSC